MAKKHRKKQSTFPLPVIILGAVLVIAAALIFLLQSRNAQGTPVLAVEPQKIDYGDVKLDTELTFEIKVINKGDGALRFLEKPYIEILEGC